MMPGSSYDAVVLAGGRSRRMNAADKTRLLVGGRSLLDRVLGALTGAASVIVVGEERPTDRPVQWAPDRVPDAGPAAALAVGLEHVTSALVVVLAGDLPFITGPHVDELVGAVESDGAVYVDDTGREQWLCGAWRADALRALAFSPGSSLRATLAGLDVNRLRPRVSGPQVWFDCDSPADIKRAEDMMKT
jgi:molybdopterin-guanine dinucleotide biosynthesis protein A